MAKKRASNGNTEVRIVTNEEVKAYIPLVNKFLRDSVVKNWKEATTKKGMDEISLGNTGMTMADMRQYLMCEVVVGLQKYNPDYRTKDGKPVKEFSFIFNHLYNRIGQTMKRLTKKSKGYSIWSSSIESILNEQYGDDV